MENKRRETQSEGAQPMSDAQIVDEVLKEQSASSTFLASMGYASSSRRSGSSTSAARIQELEERLEQKEIEARDANERYQRELSARLQAQEGLIEEMRRKQQEELDAVKKSQQDKIESFEKKQQEMDALLNYILRNQATQQAAPMRRSDGT